MTQIEEARRGHVTPEMEYVARREKLEPETVRDEVGRGRAMWLRSPRRRGLERRILAAGRTAGLDVHWVADAGEGLSDHREFTLAGEVAAKLGVPDNPARHTAADVPARLEPRTFRRVGALLADFLRDAR